MFKRILNIDKIISRKSLFLLGPRQSGKSTYLSLKYKDAFTINLLKAKEYFKFKADPSLFSEEIKYQILNNKKTLFIIDEIQKIPELLDEIHQFIEEFKQVRFILTGSSTRKLKKSGVNLLGGRASRIYFHPIISAEYGFNKYEKDLVKNLTYGFLPSILNSMDPWADLEDYVALYLKEEIQQEAIVRSLDGFSRFLNTVATTNAQLINFTELGSDAQVPPRTIREYYQVLEDTLVGSLLPAFQKTKSRKAISTAKFYLFDPGVTNFLLERKSVSSKTTEFGVLLEQAIFCELKAYLDYHQMSDSLFYWRSTSQFEVDFLIRDSLNQWIAIEVKSSSHPEVRDYKGLFAMEDDLNLKKKIVVCLSDAPRITDKKVEILPIRIFLEQLWNDDLITIS